MNKKIILGTLVVLAGFVTLTAFGGKTLEQQKQEIAAEITAQLDEFRAQKQEECTMRVNEEAQRLYNEYDASMPAPTTAKPGSSTKTKSKTKPVVKDPLPQTKPAEPSTRDRGDAVDPANNRERGDAVPPTNNRQRGDAVKKKEGGK